MEATIVSKKVKVILESGGAPYSVVSTASTWGELKRDLDNIGVSYEGKSPIDGKNQTEFVSNDSVLPTSDFTLFLMGDHKVKSGGYSPKVVEAVRKSLSWKKGNAASAERLGISTADYIAIKAQIRAHGNSTPIETKSEPKVVNTSCQVDNSLLEAIYEKLLEIEAKIGNTVTPEAAPALQPVEEDPDFALLRKLKGDISGGSASSAASYNEDEDEDWGDDYDD